MFVSRRILVAAICAASALGVTDVHAQSGDKLRLTLGSYSVYCYDSTISLAVINAGGGVHMMSLSVDLDADITTSGIDAHEADTTVPLQVESFALRYDVTPKRDWISSSSAISNNQVS